MLTPAAGVVVGNRYVLSRLLAKGGMGSVWIARHRDLDVDVTVKFMMPTLVDSVELRTRFEREAKVAARLRSQHVVQVLDFGIDDGLPYIAMELLQGESLADRLKRDTRLSLAATTQLATQVCKALRTAHEAGLVHRDLKPGNIFLAHKDGEEVAKVLDFGIVKDNSNGEVDDLHGATATGVMMGSVHYMSPEQIRSSRQVDHRSDLWSLAVILYKMLTGEVPFPGMTQGDVMIRVCTDTCAPPSVQVPTLSSAIDVFFERALTREPAGRFQSAQEMSDALVAAAAAQPAKQRWVKTLPLNQMPSRQLLQQSMGNLSNPRASMPSVPEPQRPVVPENQPSTFQAVTMQGRVQVAPGTAIAPRAASPNKGLIVAGVALSVVLMGLVTAWVVRSKKVDSLDAHPPVASANSAAPANSLALTNTTVQGVTSSTATSVPVVVPISDVSAKSAVSKPTTSPVVGPKSGPAPRKNPLDIHD